MCVILLYTNAVTNAKTISDVFCVHSLRLATKNTAKKQPPKQECAPGIRTRKKEMTCFIIRCFFEQKKKITKKNETLSTTSFFMHRAYFVLIVFQPN